MSMKLLRRAVSAVFLVSALGCGPQTADQAEPSAKGFESEVRSQELFGVPAGPSIVVKSIGIVKKKNTAQELGAAINDIIQKENQILAELATVQSEIQLSVIADKVTLMKTDYDTYVKQPLTWMGNCVPGGIANPACLDGSNIVTYSAWGPTLLSDSMFYQFTYNSPPQTWTPAVAAGSWLEAVGVRLFALYFFDNGLSDNTQFVRDHSYELCQDAKFANSLVSNTSTSIKTWADAQCYVQVTREAPDCSPDHRPYCIQSPYYDWVVYCPANPATYPFQVFYIVNSSGYEIFGQTAARAAGNAALAAAQLNTENAWGVPEATSLRDALMGLLGSSCSLP